MNRDLGVWKSEDCALVLIRLGRQARGPDKHPGRGRTGTYWADHGFSRPEARSAPN